MTIGDFRELCVDSSELGIRIYTLDGRKLVFKGLFDYADDYLDYTVEKYELEANILCFYIEYYEEIEYDE